MHGPGSFGAGRVSLLTVHVCLQLAESTVQRKYGALHAQSEDNGVAQQAPAVPAAPSHAK